MAVDLFFSSYIGLLHAPCMQGVPVGLAARRILQLLQGTWRTQTRVLDSVSNYGARSVSRVVPMPQALRKLSASQILPEEGL